MNRADRKRWESARTLADLGALMALWLEGEIGTAPGYDGGPAPETAELVPVLAAANRAGFVTYGSQPGGSGWNAGSGLWQQRAAVEGFASLAVASRLDDAAADAGLDVRIQEATRWRLSWKHAIPVSLWNGTPFTRFGTQLSRRHLRDSWIGYGVCHRAVVAEVCAALQVTIVDPDVDRNDRLWPALREFAEQEASTP
jgi:hypothetical protein